MGNKTSATVVQKSVTDIITSTIVNSIQSEASITNVKQSVNVDCSATRDNIMNKYAACIDKYKKQCNLTTNTLSECDESALKLCNSLSPENLECIGENITLKNTLNINLTTTQISNITAGVENKLKEDLKSDLEQKNSGLFASKVNAETEINTLVSIVTNTLINSVLESLQQTNFSQEVNIFDGTGKYITIENTSDIIKTTIQNNTAVTKAIADLDKKFDSSIKQTTGLDIYNIIMLMVGIVCSFIIILLFWFIFSRLTRKKQSPLSKVETKS
jgi:hypothetical protein